jgi:hypothetical protein
VFGAKLSEWLDISEPHPRRAAHLLLYSRVDALRKRTIVNNNIGDVIAAFVLSIGALQRSQQFCTHGVDATLARHMHAVKMSQYG